MPPLGGQLVRYGATGLVNTAIGLAVTFTLHLGAGVGLVGANAAGYAVGWGVSFALNRGWTFRHDGPVLRGMLSYAILVLLAFVVTMLAIKGLLFIGLPYAVAQVASVPVYSVVVFTGARHVVFAQPR